MKSLGGLSHQRLKLLWVKACGCETRLREKEKHHWTFLVFVAASLSGCIRRSKTKTRKGKRMMKPMNKFLISWGASFAGIVSPLEIQLSFALKLTHFSFGAGWRAELFFLWLLIEAFFISLFSIVGDISWFRKIRITNILHSQSHRLPLRHLEDVLLRRRKKGRVPTKNIYWAVRTHHASTSYM